MTLKEAIRYMIHLFFIITVCQMFAVILVGELVTGAVVESTRLFRILTLSLLVSLPVIILVPSKNQTKKERIIRLVVHFIVTTAILYTYYFMHWPTTTMHLVVVSCTYIVIYAVGQFVWNWYVNVVKVRRLEIEEHARSEAKGQFLAQMSHEIRTPILSVLGIAEIQFHKNADRPAVQSAFSQIYNAANTLTDILNSILDLSKIEAGKMEINTKKFDVPSLIQDVTQLHAVALESKAFNFKLSVDEKIPTSLFGDEVRIRQVLNNLLSNSFKYTEKGLVQIEVKSEPAEDSKWINLVIVIEDTGCGMTKEQVNLLLSDEYRRFAEKERPHIHGTGLGISIVQKIVSLMNASLTISSKPDVGTKVTVSIPLQIAGTLAIGAATARQLEALGIISTNIFDNAIQMPWARVLVVDDIETNLHVVSGLLALYELQIETCTNAADAIRKVKNGEVYDLIFMDYMMPEMDGMTATKIMRELGYMNTIVVLSANVFDEQREEFLTNGFDDFLAKPIKTEMLHELLIKHIKLNIHD